MTAPSIAIVILNWNGKQLLEQFLPTVLANSQHAAARVIIADNASTDGSCEWVKREYPQVDVISFDKNHGFAAGYNKALDKLDDDYFILLNSDAVPENGWLLPFFDAIAQSNIEVAMPKIRSYKDPSKFEYAGAAGGFIDKFGYPFCRGRIFEHTEEDFGQYDIPTEIFWASGAALFVKNDLFKKVGGLDEDFFAHMEEIDLCWRLKNRGHKIWYLPQSTVYHVGGASLHQSHPRKTYLNFRNNLYLLLKNLPSNKLIQTLLVRMILDGVATVKFILSFEFAFAWAVLKSHISFYANIRTFVAKRQRLKAQALSPATSQIFQGSIVYEYFAKGTREFSRLKF